MAQSGYTPILIYSSSTASNLPSASNLTNSTLGAELAINIADGKLFYKDAGNAVQVIAWKVTPTTAGGTGLDSYTAGDLIYYASGTTFSKLAIGATGRYMSSTGSAPQWTAPAALTKTDDTNVTLTLGGSASTALLNAASLTLGWTGTLAITRGGTGLSTVAQGDILYGSAANTLAALAKNTSATRYLSNTGASNNPAWAQIDLTNGVTGTLPTGNGGTGLTTFTANGLLYATSTSALATSSGLQYNGTNLTNTGQIFAIGAEFIGYGTGAGGTVTQGAGSGKATAVTLTKPCGTITMNNAALGAGASVNFVVNNNLVSQADTIIVNTVDDFGQDYTAVAWGIWDGYFYIKLTNNTGGSRSEAVRVNFTVLNSVRT